MPYSLFWKFFNFLLFRLIKHTQNDGQKNIFVKKKMYMKDQCVKLVFTDS